MREDEAELPEERVKRALGRLGADHASAPDVPPAVTARISAALRSASPPPAHTTSAWRPGMLALVIGVGAALAAAAVGLALLLHAAPAPRFPSGPTAERMTGVPDPRRHAQTRGHPPVVRAVDNVGTPRLTLVFVLVPQ